MYSRGMLFALAAVNCVQALAHPPQQGILAQYRRQQDPTIEQERAAAVKRTFEIGWEGYYQHAFPNDALKPISNGFDNGFGGWGATAVDALSTAILMGETDIVNTIVEFIPTIDFSTSEYQISLFETTIRYLGGLLGAYDLLKDPRVGGYTNATAVEAILQQAVNLADRLSFAFDTPSGVPYNNIFFTNNSNDGSENNGLATTGTLILEWTRLSDLTGDPKYYNLVQVAESYLLNPSPPSSEPFPGLVGTDISIENGSFLDALGGWNGGTDSFYEYLIKMFIYDTSRFSEYRDRWIVAADSSIEYLTSHPSSRPDLTFLAAYNGTTLRYVSQHLACFDGGNFILGGIVLGEQKYIDFGLELVAGCHETYNATLTGIGPESFSWTVNGTEGVPENQTEFYERAGFYITDSHYILRPEVLESFYYAYRVTGDQKYREWTWNGYLAINSTTRAGSGYAELIDVNAPNGGGFQDLQDSFFFAEVLKYAYLIHVDDDAPYQVKATGGNEYVFNTEAHPVRVAGTPI